MKKDFNYLDFSKLNIYRYRGLENTEKVFKMAIETKNNNNSNLVIKVILKIDNKDKV